MGLNKTITMENGADATYWNISGFPPNVIPLTGFLNKDVRDEDGQSLGIIQHNLSREAKTAIKTIIYNDVKANNEIFVDAEDNI